MKSLAWFTVFMTFVLMVWGNTVSATGTGMACGPDWPYCAGTFFPPLEFGIILEWGHRWLAAITSLLILATLIKVWRLPGGAYGSHTPTLKRVATGIITLLVFQIAFGAITVKLDLSVMVSTIHLITATLVWSGLIYIAVSVSDYSKKAETFDPKLRRLALVGLGGFVVQLALGALVRHSGAGLACPTFPACATGFFPDPINLAGFLAFAHRWWGIALLGIFVHLFLQARRNFPSVASLAGGTFALAIFQVVLGIGTVLSNLHTHSRAFHAGVGYLLWALLFLIFVKSINVGRAGGTAA